MDRDPPNGIDRWNFVVQAIDDEGHGLVGYADILVTLTDINDNKPFFDGGPFVGYITENQDVNGKQKICRIFFVKRVIFVFRPLNIFFRQYGCLRSYDDGN